MSKCVRIQIVEDLGIVPNEYIDPNDGCIYLDLDVDAEIPRKKGLPQTTIASELKDEAALGFTAKPTPKNVFILQRRTNPAIYQNDFKPIRVVASEGGSILPQDTLAVITEDKGGFSCEVQRGGTSWIKGLTETKLNTLDWDDYTITKEGIREMWENEREYVAGNNGFNWLLAFFGGWSQGKSEVPAGIYQKIGIADLRPVFNPYAILKKAFCKFGWKFESPFLESEIGRIWYDYILDERYTYQSQTLLDSLKFIVNTHPEQLELVPFPTFGTPIPFINEVLNPSGHFNWQNKRYEPQGAIECDLVANITVECIDFKGDEGAKVFFHILQRQGNGVKSFAYSEIQVTQDNPIGTGNIKVENVGIIEGDSYECIITGFYYPDEYDYEWKILSCEFYNVPKSRPFNENDTFKPSEIIDRELTGMDYLKGVAGNISGLIETDYAARTVRLLQPFTADVFNDIDVEGFFRNTTVIDFTPLQICDSEKPTPVNNKRQRYTRLEFQQTTDPNITALKLPKENPLHSRTIDWGENYEDGTEIVTNPLYEPTLNDGVLEVVLEGYPIDMPVLTDNTEDKVSYGLGARCLLFGHYGTQYELLDGVYQASLNWGILKQLLDSPDINRPYFYQLPNAYIDGVDFVKEKPVGNLVYGYEDNDLYTICWRAFLVQQLQNIEIEALVKLGNFFYSKSNFRDLFKLYYAGREIFARLIEVSDFSGCNDDAARLNFLPVVARPYCAELNDNGDGEPCNNTVVINVEDYGDCQRFSYEHEGDGTIESVQWEIKLATEQTWTTGATTDAWTVCNQGETYSVRLIVTFEEEDCNNIVRVVTVDLCGNTPQCILNKFQENGTWFVEFILGGEVNCEYSMLVEYNINNTEWQVYTYGSPLPVPFGSHIEFRAVITWTGSECENCDPITLECDIDIEDAPANDCAQNLPELIFIEISQQGKICYEFDIGGTSVSEMSHFIVKWQCEGGEVGTWQTGDPPICCEGLLTAYAVVFWCDDCPPVCTEGEDIEPDCIDMWENGTPINWAVCEGCTVNLRTGFLNDADSGGYWVLDFFSEGCTGSEDGQQPNSPQLIGDNPAFNFGNNIGCFHFTYHSPYEVGDPCYVDPVSFIVNVLPAANAGIGSQIKMCQTDPEITLWTLISGGADESGEWSGNGVNTAGYNPLVPTTPTDDIFDPSIMSEGTYNFIYTVEVEVPSGFNLYSNCGDCLTDSTTVTIIVNNCGTPPCPEAGTGQTIQACGDCAFSLFDFLIGAESGGNWSQGGGSGTIDITGGDSGDVDFTGAPSGEYIFIYTQVGEGCTDFATVTVLLSSLPEAGNGIDFEICEESIDNVANYFVGGDAGGTYTISPALPEGSLTPSGILTTAAGDAGVYTITRIVQGIISGQCVDDCNDSETLEVTILEEGCTMGSAPPTITVCQDGTGGVEGGILSASTLLGATCGGSWWSFGVNDCSAGNNQYNGVADVFSVNGGAVQNQGAGIPDGATVNQFQNLGCHLFLFVPSGNGDCAPTQAVSLILEVVDCGGGGDPCTNNVTIEQTACVASVDTAIDCVIAFYQWQISFNGGATWQSISGANGSTYTGNEGDLIRLVYSCDGGCGGASNPVTLSGCTTSDCDIDFTGVSINGSGQIVGTFEYENLQGTLMWTVDRSQVGDNPTPDCGTCGGWIVATGSNQLSFGGGTGTFTHTPNDGDRCYRLRLWDSADIGGCFSLICIAVTGSEECEVTIIQTLQTCDFEMVQESGVLGVSGNKFDLVNVNDSVTQEALQRVYVESSCAGIIDDDIINCSWKLRSRANSDAWGNNYFLKSIEVRDTDSAGSVTVLDLNPDTSPYISCGGAGSCGCSALTAGEIANLTFSFGNGTAAAAAIRKLIVNALCIEFGAVDGVNYELEVQVSNAQCVVSFYSKHNPSGLWVGANVGDDIITSNNSIDVVGNYSGGSSVISTFKNYTLPCDGGQLTTAIIVAKVIDGITLGTIQYDSAGYHTQTVDANDIVQIGTENLLEEDIESVQLVASPTDCDGTASYVWRDAANQILGTTDTIYVCAGDGEIEVTMTCSGNGCSDTATVTV